MENNGLPFVTRQSVACDLHIYTRGMRDRQMIALFSFELEPDTIAVIGDEFNLLWQADDETKEKIMVLSDNYCLDPLYAWMLSLDKAFPKDHIEPIKTVVFKVEEQETHEGQLREISAAVQINRSVERFLSNSILQFRSNTIDLSFLSNYDPRILLETAYRLGEEHDINIEFYIDSCKTTQQLHSPSSTEQ